jgi:hypothetical protein
MKTIENKLGLFEIHHMYVFARFHEGVDLRIKHAPDLIDIMSEHFNGPFGWIADRVNQYSVDPYIARMMVDDAPRLSCWCNVMHKKTLIDLLPFVKRVVPKDFPKESFGHLLEAINWTEKQVALASASNPI